MMNELRTTTHAYNFLNRLNALPTHESKVYHACLGEALSLDEIAQELHTTADEALMWVYALSNRGLLVSQPSDTKPIAYSAVATEAVRVAIAKGYWF